jgi:sialate O-acetylesterase
MKTFAGTVSLAASLLLPSGLAAQVRVPNVLSDHAVLQRDRPARLWGWGRPGETIDIKIHDQHASAKVDASGRWQVFLRPETAGGPYELDIEGSSKIVLKDIDFGDVYFASGQSNMGYSFAGIQDSVMPHAREVLAAATDPNLRLLRIPKTFIGTPQQDQPTKWAQSSPQSASEFSLLGYLFGRAISDREHIPVGIIQAAYGGTPVEAWVSAGALADAPELKDALAEWSTQIDLKKVPGDAPLAQPAAVVETVPESVDKPKARGPQHHPGNWAASALFNAMVAPVTNYTIKGVIWYQGESSADPTRALAYSDVFDRLIVDWRKQWDEPDFPFIYVQLSSYMAAPNMSWGTVRDAQRRALSVPNTAMAVTYDIGFPHNPHPPLKQLTADRIVLAARALVYGEKVESSGPLFEQAKREGSGMRVSFTHAEGLQGRDGTIKGFDIAGADGNFIPATAAVNGNTVIVASPSVPDPRYVRYAWANFTDANLYNGAALPAAAFTSVGDKN